MNLNLWEAQSVTLTRQEKMERILIKQPTMGFTNILQFNCSDDYNTLLTSEQTESAELSNLLEVILLVTRI